MSISCRPPDPMMIPGSALFDVIQGSKALDVMAKLKPQGDIYGWCLKNSCTGCTNGCFSGIVPTPLPPPPPLSASYSVTLLGLTFNSSVQTVAANYTSLPPDLQELTYGYLYEYALATIYAPIDTCVNPPNPVTQDWCQMCNNSASCGACVPTYTLFRQIWTSGIGLGASTFLNTIIPSIINCPNLDAARNIFLTFPGATPPCSAPDIPSYKLLEVILGAKGLAVMGSLNCGNCYTLITKDDLLGKTFDTSLEDIDELELPVNVIVPFGTFKSSYNQAQQICPLQNCQTTPCSMPPNPPCTDFQSTWQVVGSNASTFLATLLPNSPTAVCRINLTYPA